MNEPASSHLGATVPYSAAASADGTPRLTAALHEYQAALEAGRRPNRAEFLARFADVAAELALCLDGLEFVCAATRGACPLVAPSADAPARLGDFRLVREVGRGGMGVVYEAEQVSLGRRVALKILPFAAALDDRQRQRFQNEARAAAQLHHPHIVPALAVGCEAGVHYYAMPFVDGQSLAERGREGPDRFRAVAELLAQAAGALEHAHQCGVVHRDVKPANLLVAGDQLWVADFGLARVRGDVGLTVTGDVIGTLRYMSPEQALANREILDHRTDIYSLGATAYELATDAPPFAESERETLLRRIALDAPRRPRRVNPAVPRDLETIVLKAMEKNPADRYATAQEMADDLRRFVRGEPVRARRQPPWQVAARWARRHAAIVATTAAAAAVVVVVLAGAVARLSAINGELWDQQAQTETARGEAARNAAEARQQAARAERTTEVAVHALHNVALEFADNRLRDDPLWGKKAERFLDETVKTCRDLAKLDGVNPQLRASAAAGCRRAAQAYAELGRGEKARTTFAEAVALSEAVVREYPDHFMPRLQLAATHREFGLLLRSLGEKEAADQFRLALDTWSDPQPISPCPYEMSEAHDNLGDLRAEAGDAAGAEEHYGRSLELRQRLAKMTNGHFLAGFHMISDHVRLAHLRHKAGDRTAADRHFRAAMDLADKLAEEFPKAPAYALEKAECSRHLGDLHEPVDPRAAQDHFRRALAALPKVIADSPGLAGPRQLQADLHARLGSLARADRRPDEATAHFRTARDLLTALAADLPDGGSGPGGPGGPGYNENNLAWFLATCPDPQFRDPARAVELARRAIEKAPKQADNWNTLGVALYRAGQAGDAAPALERAIACRVGGGDACDYFFLAMARQQLGDDGSRRAYDEAVQWLKRFPGALSRELDGVRGEAQRALDRLPQTSAFDNGPPAEAAGRGHDRMTDEPVIGEPTRLP